MKRTTMILAALVLVGCAEETEPDPLCWLTAYPEVFSGERPEPIVSVDEGDGWIDPEYTDCYGNTCVFSCNEDTTFVRLQWPGVACEDTILKVVGRELVVNVACE